jgi:hypothetical protein
MPKTLSALMWAVVLVTAGASFAAQEMYLRAEIDQQGQLRIVTSQGREIVPDKEQDQVGFDQAAISADRRAVGWLALFPNCCTTYPIPLKLVIYVNGRQQTFSGIGVPVWRWAFSEDGKRVAFQQETVHGGLGVHYELRDTSSGRLVAEYDPNPPKPGTPPAWLRALDPARPAP